MSYYLIQHYYVGVNKRDRDGNPIGATWNWMQIYTRPGYTIQGGQVRTDGDLGTYNDFSSYACGEFEDLEDAISMAADEGFTHQFEPDKYPYSAFEEDSSVGYWRKEEDGREQMDAREFFLSVSDREQACLEYGITAEMSDTDLYEAAFRAEEEAREHNYEIHGCTEFFEELREELREDEDLL